MIADFCRKIERASSPTAVAARGLLFPREQWTGIRERCGSERYAAVWKSVLASADAVAGAGRLDLPGDTMSVYYYARGRLANLALAAAVTSDPRYTDAYRVIVNDLADRELNFWIGPEYPNRPRTQVHDGIVRYTGELETAALGAGLAISFDWIGPLLADEDRRTVLALLTGIVYPLLRNSTRFQSERWVMNHLCVIASALALVAFTIEGTRADVSGGPLTDMTTSAGATTDAPVLFTPEEAAHIGRAGIPLEADLTLIRGALGSWMRTIDADGSYGEGFHYWAYPVNCLFFALSAFSNVRNEELPETACLKRSLEWAVYNQVGLYEHPEFDRPVAVAVNTYDCPYVFQLEAPEVLLYLRVFHDPLAAWYLREYLLPDPPRPDALHTAFHVFPAALLTLDDPEVPARSPAELCLPPSRVFHDTGFVYLRDGFERIDSARGDTVFSLLSGGGGRANSHQHLDKNSVSLYAYGEYWIVDPGHSCYRGSHHSTYDRRTVAHNTLTIDGEDQSLGFVEKGMKPEERLPVISHHNRAEVVRKRHYSRFDYIESDGRACYDPPLAAFTRRVWFIRNDYFVIWDRVDLGDHRGSPALGLNLNNRDGALGLELHATGLRASRPHSDLAVELIRPRGPVFDLSDGRLHLAYHTLAGQRVEGEPGSAKRVDFRIDPSTSAFDLVWLVAPLETGEVVPRVSEIGDSGVPGETLVEFRGRITAFRFGEPTTLRFADGAEYRT